MNDRRRKLFGRKIKRARKKKKITQHELAIRIGISQSNLSKIEAGVAPIALDTWIKIEKEVELSYGQVKNILDL